MAESLGISGPGFDFNNYGSLYFLLIIPIVFIVAGIYLFRKSNYKLNKIGIGIIVVSALVSVIEYVISVFPGSEPLGFFFLWPIVGVVGFIFSIIGLFREEDKFSRIGSLIYSFVYLVFSVLSALIMIGIALPM